MLPEYKRVKGIHPGVILQRELRKRSVKSIDLANSITAHCGIETRVGTCNCISHISTELNQ